MCKQKPLHSDLAIHPEQLLVFSQCSEALEETPRTQTPRRGTAQTSCFPANPSLGAAWAWGRVIY